MYVAGRKTTSDRSSPLFDCRSEAALDRCRRLLRKLKKIARQMERELPRCRKPPDADVYVNVRGKTLGFRRQGRSPEKSPQKQRMKAATLVENVTADEKQSVSMSEVIEKPYRRRRPNCLFSQAFSVGHRRFLGSVYERARELVEFQVYDPVTSRSWSFEFTDEELVAFAPQTAPRYKLDEVHRDCKYVQSHWVMWARPLLKRFRWNVSHCCLQFEFLN